jgi:hypothetical protein
MPSVGLMLNEPYVILDGVYGVCADVYPFHTNWPCCVVDVLYPSAIVL